MENYEKLFTPFKLKNIERKGIVNNRQESTAEHIYAAIMVAKYFLKKTMQKIDKEKVFSLILYHDLPEIHAGDTFILDKEGQKTQKHREQKSFEKLLKELPKELIPEFKESWQEFSEQKTIESRFVKAIDELEAVIHNTQHPELWKKYGFTEKKLRKYKEHHFTEFPEIVEFFNKMVEALKKKQIIPQEKN